MDDETRRLFSCLVATIALAVSFAHWQHSFWAGVFALAVVFLLWMREAD
jgi:apolipoprotein N-acyltransferase